MYRYICACVRQIHAGPTRYLIIDRLRLRSVHDGSNPNYPRWKMKLVQLMLFFCYAAQVCKSERDEVSVQATHCFFFSWHTHPLNS